MRFHHYKLLIWKNFRLKLYRWYFILLEMIYPISILIMILSPHERKPGKTIISYPSTPGSDLLGENSSIELCYSPSTLTTTAFMKNLDNVRKKLGLNITSLPSQTELESYLLNSDRDDLIGVHFRNLKSSTSKPNKFSYILKQLIAHPRFGFPLDFSLPFIKAQLLLDENFMEYIKPDDTTDFEKTLKQLVIKPSPKIEQRGKIKVKIAFGVLLAITFLTSFMCMKDIFDEKDSGIKEWMKITGVNELTMWLTWFVYALSIYPFSITISAAMTCSIPDGLIGIPVINHTPFVVLWLIWILYCIANISFCFMLTTISNVAEVHQILFILYCCLSCAIPILADEITEFLPASVLCLSPIFALFLGFHEIELIETEEIMFTWSVFTNSQKKKFPVPFGLLYLLCILVVDTLLYLFLTYYITNINTGKFGVRKSPFFLFERLFSRKTGHENLHTSSSRNVINGKYFESPSSNLKPAIRIIDLYKNFKSLHVVRGMNLVTYKDEITAVLGHNGAGKTTIISILTGLIPPSSGYVYYKDMDVFKNMDKFRLIVGLCPQENRTFSYLSVMDHLLFFGQLKGASEAEAAKEAKEYLRLTGMEARKRYPVDMLSGGMKRKLCLMISMMGKAEVLLLDEPSSGIDTESRRSFWDLLLKLREGRSIIFTTHYMEEADALSNRIAIIDHGVEVCYGTPVFLKKAFDTGYELTISKSIDNSIDITHLVQSALPSASLVSDNKREIVFKLPLTESHRFSRLFQSLESV